MYPETFSPLKPPFKSCKNQWYTSVLFRERWVDIPIEDRVVDCQFSLYGDYPSLINCKATFIELADPTGYQWATQYLGSWDHWERLLRAPWFQEAVETWVRELKVKLKQEAIQKVREIAQGSSPQSLPASKYIAGADWEGTKSVRGRPSKEELRGKLKESVKLIQEEQEDMKRIGLTVIPGGRS